MADGIVVLSRDDGVSESLIEARGLEPLGLETDLAGTAGTSLLLGRLQYPQPPGCMSIGLVQSWGLDLAEATAGPSVDAGNEPLR
jgi:hypothetical protein